MGWKWAVQALALAGLLAPLAAAPAAAQYVYLTGGNTASADDPFCQDPTSAITMLSAGYSDPLYGISAEYNTGDWPWVPPPPDGSTGALRSRRLADPVAASLAASAGAAAGTFLTHGWSLQFMAQINPAKFVASGVNRYVRPFIGLGLHISTDGTTRPDTGNGPTFAVRGQTRPFIAYGANGFLDITSRLGVTAGYRGTSVFFGDFEFDTPSGEVETAGGKTLNSRSWAFGFTYRLGN